MSTLEVRRRLGENLSHEDKQSKATRKISPVRPQLGDNLSHEDKQSIVKQCNFKRYKEKQCRAAMQSNAKQCEELWWSLGGVLDEHRSDPKLANRIVASHTLGFRQLPFYFTIIISVLFITAWSDNGIE